MFTNMKQPKPPDRPLVPYMRYSRKMWAKVRGEHAEAQLWDISKIIGHMWKEVPDSEKMIYQQEFDVEKVEYDKAMKSYHNSAAYQAFLNQKGTASSKMPQNMKMSRNRMDIGGVVIQSVDEDLETNELSGRRIAAVRFDRNHRLIAELLSSSIVNDTRMVVAQQRMELLRKQAASLIQHQSKLESELSKLDEVFLEKKRLIETSSEEFAENLKKVCDEKVVVEQSKYEEMIEEWTGKLATAYEDYKKKQEEMEKKLASEREKMAEKTPVLYNLAIGDEQKTEKEEGQKEKKEIGEQLQNEEKMETEDKSGERKDKENDKE